jgi:hypothetical protein
MPKNVTQYDLLISCPSDVKEEIAAVRDVVDNFNRMIGAINNAVISTKHWSTDSYPESGGKAQELLNKQFVMDCDAVVAVFWTRFGTPTDEYGSETEEEIEKLITAGKQVFLYFSDCLIKPSSIDNNQYQNILNFREKYKDKGIYITYSSIDEFKKLFLNHISLYFISLLTDGNTVVQSQNIGSKLSIKGLVDANIKDTPKVIKKNLLESQFLINIKNNINKKINQIEEIILSRKVIKPEENVKNDKIKIPGSINGFSLINEALQSQLKPTLNMFRTSKIIIEKEYIDTIKKYVEENDIDIDYDEFFYIGDLMKQESPFQAPIGFRSSYSIKGSTEEKDKYNLIKKLYSEVNEYYQYVRYFSDISEKYYLELALSNSGTNYDEDIDIKIYIKKGLLCTNEQLPIPGDDIVEVINEAFKLVFIARKTISINEYNDYPQNKFTPNAKALLLSSYDNKVENNQNKYKYLIEKTFCYDYFQDAEHDIICYKQKYIKQNTNIFLPSRLFFNGKLTKIHYEITSKHCPNIIKGELEIC